MPTKPGELSKRDWGSSLLWSERCTFEYTEKKDRPKVFVDLIMCHLASFCSGSGQS